MSRRVAFNLVVLLALTGALLTYAAIVWLGGSFFNRSYQVVVPVADVGNVLEDQQVTVLGHAVGWIKGTRLTNDGAELVLSIREHEVVPTTAVVQILRRSPIGEQAVNLVPVASDWRPPPGGRVVPGELAVPQGWEAAAKNARIDPKAVVTPTDVTVLMDQTERLLAAVKPRDAGTLVHELSDAVGGRGELLQRLNREVLDLNQTLVQGIPDFQRLLDTSAPVLAALDEHKRALAAGITSTADLSETLAAKRPTIENLLATAPQFLKEADALVTNTKPNVSCLFNDLAAIQADLAKPENAEGIKRILDLNRFFYYGFDAAAQYDPERPGVIWQRANLVLLELPRGHAYVPHRPTPATRPGGACESPFGPGVDAVRQANPLPVEPTSPGIDYAALRQAVPGIPSVPLASSGRPPSQTAAQASAAPGVPEPVRRQGAGAMPGMLAPLSIAAAIAFRRRR